MTSMSLIVEHLDALLNPGLYDDYGPNGLQVPGRDDVETVVTGVSANVDLFLRAREEGADLVLVHHGLFWAGPPRALDRASKRRLQLLFDTDMALAAYHLPLDGHLEHGNNALLAAAVRGADPQPFAEQGGRPIGIRVTVPEPDGLTIAELAARVRDAVGGREPLVVDAGPERIRTLGIVSGAASDEMLAAIDLGLDAFLTGEPAERAFSIATDAGIHFLAAGHHATETFGVRRLGELLAREFGVRHVYVDVPNPI
jgi:dinuclear metal center YbgI/SA1388 family protein